ncbi:Os09g0276000, partial [Oryza sativa Japonica Group]
MARRLRFMPVTVARIPVHVGKRSGMLKPLARPTPDLMAARNSAAFFLFFPNAARDTMLLVTLWNITLRFTGVVGPAARISFTRIYLVFPDVTEGEDALGAEDLGGAELAELAPVVAGGGEEDVDPLVADDLAGEQPGPRREVGVVGLEHRARRLLGGGHHQRRLPELQHHQRAVHRRELPQLAVREHVHQVVHAADHRQPPRPRRRPGTAMPHQEQLQQLQHRHGRHRQQQRLVEELVHGDRS